MKKRKKAVDRLIKKLENQKKDIDRSIEIIETIPLNEPLLFTHKTFTWAPGFTKRVEAHLCVAGIPIAFNDYSLRVTIIGSEKNVWPYKDTRKPHHPIKYIQILDWKPLKSEDYPLLAGYELLYPLFQELMSKVD